MSGIFHDPGDPTAGSVVLFGSGAVGSAVHDALRKRNLTRFRRIDIPWTTQGRQRALGRALDLVESRGRVAVVWAAGTAGFSATREVCDIELAAFGDLVGLLEHLEADQVSLHLVSSAGGLFEGATRVALDVDPNPIRPYGVMKASQERLAYSLADQAAVRIYRPSTVYGPPLEGHRLGLVSALMRNGLRRRPTALYGAMDTLRDYVSAHDVARRVAMEATSARLAGLDIQMLVSGHPVPISRVIDLVESTLRRSVLVSFVEAWNARHITFYPAVRAAGFNPEPLRTGVTRAFVEYLGRA